MESLIENSILYFRTKKGDIFYYWSGLDGSVYKTNSIELPKINPFVITQTTEQNIKNPIVYPLPSLNITKYYQIYETKFDIEKKIWVPINTIDTYFIFDTSNSVSKNCELTGLNIIENVKIFVYNPRNLTKSICNLEQYDDKYKFNCFNDKSLVHFDIILIPNKNLVEHYKEDTNNIFFYYIIPIFFIIIIMIGFINIFTKDN